MLGVGDFEAFFEFDAAAMLGVRTSPVTVSIFVSRFATYGGGVHSNPLV